MLTLRFAPEAKEEEERQRMKEVSIGVFLIDSLYDVFGQAI